MNWQTPQLGNLHNQKRCHLSSVISIDRSSNPQVLEYIIFTKYMLF